MLPLVAAAIRVEVGVDYFGVHSAHWLVPLWRRDEAAGRVRGLRLRCIPHTSRRRQRGRPRAARRTGPERCCSLFPAAAGPTERQEMG